MYQAIILAAGKGTRMQSETHKVLQPLGGRPMIAYTLSALAQIGIDNPVIVVGFKKDDVIREVQRLSPKATFATQENLNGSAEAVNVALPLLNESGSVLILVGDHPFYTAQTYQSLLDTHEATGAVFSMTSAIVDDPARYGRIIRDSSGRICKIVEFSALTDEYRAIKEINMGCYVANVAWLKRVTPTILQTGNGERALTRIVSEAYNAELSIVTLEITDIQEATGIDTPEALKTAEERLAR